MAAVPRVAAPAASTLRCGPSPRATAHVIDDPRPSVDEYLAHRLAREAAILAALAGAATATVDELVDGVYADVPPSSHPIARFSV